MNDRCQIIGCGGVIDVIYLDHGVCEAHWNEYTADDVPADRLRMVLGITPAASDAAKEIEMATKKTTSKRKTTAKKAPAKAAAVPKEPKPKREKAANDAARVFAIRVSDAELAAIHKTAGPRNATRFIRAVAAAFAAEDEAAFRRVLREASQARG